MAVNGGVFQRTTRKIAPQTHNNDGYENNADDNTHPPTTGCCYAAREEACESHPIFEACDRRPSNGYGCLLPGSEKIFQYL
eukprot:scaffold43873_cov153-Amphora_coffeaeformis.AAC.1